MAKWYRERLYGVQATQDTKMLWDGGSFTVRAGDWLVTGRLVSPTALSDAEWQELEGCAEAESADDACQHQILTDALRRGAY